jgi:hypothetical protein
MLKVSDFADMGATSCNLRSVWNGLSPACFKGGKNNSVGFKPVYAGAHCHVLQRDSNSQCPAC